MRKISKKNQKAFSQVYLARALEGEVRAWAQQGWSGLSKTTLELFHYWFNRDEDTEEQFYACQRQAIETIVYCHEILQAPTLKDLFERVAPEVLYQHLPLKQEVESISFPKYALKMATGSGKTWVLAALLIWQYFNQIDIGGLPKYSGDFRQLKTWLAKLIIQETHVETGKKTRTWKLDNEYFDYSHFLRQVSRAVSMRGKTPGQEIRTHGGGTESTVQAISRLGIPDNFRKSL